MEFKLITTGSLRNNIPRDQVLDNLCRIFKSLNRRQLEQLIAGQPSVVKRNLDKTTAEKYRAILAKAGAVARVEPMSIEAPDFELRGKQQHHQSSTLNSPERHASAFSSRDPSKSSAQADADKWNRVAKQKYRQIELA